MKSSIQKLPTVNQSSVGNFWKAKPTVVKAKPATFVHKQTARRARVQLVVVELFFACDPNVYTSPFSMSALGRRRASQRWCFLVSAPTSRVAKIVEPVLGESLWDKFVHHTNTFYKPYILDAFDAPSSLLCCVGYVEENVCSNDFKINLCSLLACHEPEHLHFHHEQDVQMTCDMWV